MRVRSATMTCIAIALAGVTFFPVIWPCDPMPRSEATDGPALKGIGSVADTPALFSANEQYPFDAATRPRVASPNVAAAPAMTTEQFPPRWRQAMNAGHFLTASGASSFLLHCQLII